MAGCSKLLSSFLSAGCRGALGTAGGSAVLGSLPSAAPASSQIPVVRVFYITPCVYLFPDTSNNEILRFPPSLNF